MKPLLLFPCNGNSLEALGCLGKSWKCAGFIDDDKAKQGTLVEGIRVYGPEILARKPKAKVLATPGSSETYLLRQKIIETLMRAPQRFAGVIHPHAYVSPKARIGYNCLIMAGAVVTSNARIGNHVCILPNSVIHHDVTIDDYTIIGSNVTIAGFVHIAKNCYIGSAASIIQKVTIGQHSLVGMGANVIASVAPRTKVVGNPARSIGTIA